MSESDDTDVLLLIPPDLFLVPSSDSEESEYQTERFGYRLGTPATGVVSELFDQVQSLENRISAIESKDTSLDASLLNNSSDTQFRVCSFSTPSKGVKQPLRAKSGSVSQLSSLENTPTKPAYQFSSVPTTPSNRHSNLTNRRNCDMKSPQLTAAKSLATNAYKSNNAKLPSRSKNADPRSFSEPSIIRRGSGLDLTNMGIPHTISAVSQNRESSSVTNFGSIEARKCDAQSKSAERISFSIPLADENLKLVGKQLEQRSVKEMELAEVDELLHEMEMTEVQLAKRISGKSSYQVRQGEPSRFYDNGILKEIDVNSDASSPARRLDFGSHDNDLYNPQQSLTSATLCRDTNADRSSRISLAFNEDSLHLDETDKMISEFKTWRQNSCQTILQKIDQVNDCSKEDRPMHEELKRETHAQFNAALSNANVEPNQNIVNTDHSVAIVNGDNAHVHASNDLHSSTATSMLHSNTSRAYTPVHSIHLDSGATQFAQPHRKSYSTSTLLGCTNNDVHIIPSLGVTSKITNDAATNTEILRYFLSSNIL